MKITIDTKDIAQQVGEEMQLTDGDLEVIKKGQTIIGISNAIVDSLEALYELETKVLEEF